MQFSNRISERYESLFTTREDNNAGAEANFGRKWGWYQSIYGAAQGDVLRFDEVFKLPVHQLLTWLTFEKEKTEIEINRLKRK